MCEDVTREKLVDGFELNHVRILFIILFNGGGEKRPSASPKREARIPRAHFWLQVIETRVKLVVEIIKFNFASRVVIFV